jgi:hypothetical protein
MSAEIGRIIQLEVEDAFAAGTFDSRPERHLVRVPTLVDEQGWRELSERLDLTLEECLAIEARSRERLKARGEEAEGISARIYLASFEAAPGADD